MSTAREYIDFKLYLTDVAGSPDMFQVSLLPTAELGESVHPVLFTTSEGPYAENYKDLQNRRINNYYLFEIGKQLADWLLPKGTIRDLFGRALALVGNSRGVRLRLIIASHRLKQIPWEYVYNPFTKTEDAFGYLALDPRISIIRHEPLNMPHQLPIQMGNGGLTELNMFAASASPTNASPIAVEKEIEKIKSSLEPSRALGRVKIKPTYSKNTQWSEVANELDRPGKYQIFHFAGHGVVQEEENNITLDDIELGKLLFAGKNNEGVFVIAGSFADVMQQADIWLVTLGACETGERSATHPWHSVAGALLEHNIPVVIAMQNEIGDQAAVVFGSEFYGKLKAGLTLDEAMSWSRRQMAVKLRDQNAQLNDIEWGIPVLYTRLPDGVLVPEVVETGSLAADKTRAEIQKEVKNIMINKKETKINNSQNNTDNSQGKIEIDVKDNSGTVIGNMVGDYVGGNHTVYGPVNGHGNAVGVGAEVSLDGGININPDQSQDLNSKLQLLLFELQRVPVENQAQADEIASYAQEYVDEAQADKPREIKLKITKEGLIKAAQNLASVAPSVISIAHRLIRAI